MAGATGGGHGARWWEGGEGVREGVEEHRPGPKCDQVPQAYSSISNSV